MYFVGQTDAKYNFADSDVAKSNFVTRNPCSPSPVASVAPPRETSLPLE